MTLNDSCRKHALQLHIPAVMIISVDKETLCCSFPFSDSVCVCVCFCEIQPVCVCVMLKKIIIHSSAIFPRHGSVSSHHNSCTIKCVVNFVFYRYESSLITSLLYVFMYKKRKKQTKKSFLFIQVPFTSVV